jgi:hypothetical protein
MGNAFSRWVGPNCRSGHVHLEQRFELFGSRNHTLPGHCNSASGSRLGDTGMTAQIRAQIIDWRSWIGILESSRDMHPENKERVRLHNKAIKIAEEQIEELEAQ